MFRSLKVAWLAWKLEGLACRVSHARNLVGRWQIELQLAEIALAKEKEKQSKAAEVGGG